VDLDKVENEIKENNKLDIPSIATAPIAAPTVPVAAIAAPTALAATPVAPVATLASTRTATPVLLN
jgi:hypothetical protein